MKGRILLASLLAVALLALTSCAHNHLFNGWTVDLEPTCAEEGLRHAVCPDCGQTVTEEIIPATGNHSPVTDPRVEPTADADGLTEGSHCGVCGVVIVKQEIIPALTENAPLS